jgi:hypothetical protein
MVGSYKGRGDGSGSRFRKTFVPGTNFMPPTMHIRKKQEGGPPSVLMVHLRKLGRQKERWGAHVRVVSGGGVFSGGGGNRRSLSL